MNRLYKVFSPALIVLLVAAMMLFTASESWAGVTGKMSGVISDAKSGEPIANVNVVLVGSDFGAATNLDGEYIILNISPGQYSVSASSVGYVTVTQQQVIVYADLTTDLSFSLEPTIIQGQEVIVKAQRKVIRQDVTASTRISTGDELYNLPVANFVGAVANIGGAVGGGTNIHIRGGRRGEVAYLIDGMEVKDPIGNLRMLSIGNPAVAEMVALTGGFDAEYGNAQSAVINIVTREGSKNYHGKFKYVFDDINSHPTSKYSDHINSEFAGTNLGPVDTTWWSPPVAYQNYDYLEGSLGGPEPITTFLLPQLGVKIPGNINFFASADITGRNTSSNGIRINSSDWYKHDMSGGMGLDFNREQNYYNSSYQLSYQINPKMKLKAAYRFNKTWANVFVFRQSRFFPYDYTQQEIDGAYQSWTGNDSTYHYVQGGDDDHDGRIDEEVLNGKDDDLDGRIDEDLQLYEYNAPDHLPTRIIDDNQFLLTWNHTLSQKTFYNVKFSRYIASRNYQGANKAPNEYGEYAEKFTDLPGPDGKLNGNYDRGEPFVDVDGDGVWDKGNQANNAFAYKGFLIQGDGTEDDIGQPVPYWLDEKSYVYGFKAQLTSQVQKNHQIRSGLDFNYFDIFSYTLPYPTIDNNGTGYYTDKYHVYPADGALYATDKMEFKDITLTVGARLDFYMPGEQVQKVMAFDSSNANWNPNYVAFDTPERIKAQVSPRLGASFSITENAFLHAHYGHFYQRPKWDNVYTGVNQVQTGGTPLLGNPDLDPEKTVAFEVGIAYNPYQDYLIDVTGFLKDVKNWINAREGKYWYPEKFGQPLIGQNFAIYDNQDYAFARGIEFNLSKEYGSNMSGRITYTLSWVNAKNSYDIGTQGIRQNYTEPPQALPAGWDQRHSIVLNYGLNYGESEPLFGIKGMPGDWNLNLLWNIRSGLPYSPTDASGTRIEGQYMTERTDWANSADINISKGFNVGAYRASLWLEAFNIFNTSNLLNVDDNYGRAGSPNAFDDYSGQAGWVNDTSSPNFSQARYAGPNPDAFDNPRIVRLGLGFDF